MTGLLIAALVLLALFLIGQIRVGAAVSFDESGLLLRIKAGPLKIQILPPKKEKKTQKEKTPKKEKKSKSAKKHPAEEGAKAQGKRDIRDTISLALRFVPLLAEAAGRFRRKVRIDRLDLYVIWGAADPAAAAMGYGAGNAVMGMLWPPIEHNFKVKEYDLRVDVDLERNSPAVTGDVQATLTIGQGLTLALRLGVKALKLYLGASRERTEKKKAVQA